MKHSLKRSMTAFLILALAVVAGQGVALAVTLDATLILSNPQGSAVAATITANGFTANVSVPANGSLPVPVPSGHLVVVYQGGEIPIDVARNGTATATLN